MNRVDAFHHCVKAVKRAVLDSRKVLFALLFGERRPIASGCEVYAAVFGVKLDDWLVLLVPLESVHPVLLGNGRLVGILAEVGIGLTTEYGRTAIDGPVLDYA